MRRRRSWRDRADADNEPPDPATLRSTARNTAIGLLARREHAQVEIKRKLRDRGYDGELVLEVVDELTRQRLLSDERFGEMFIRSRAERGQGPVRLRAELRQLQLPVEQIERQLAAVALDWTELARAVRIRKFGGQPANSLSERAKQVRFLQYRGFTAEQIRAALGTRCEDDLLDAGDEDNAPPDLDPES
ncbi:MAG: regulatory protein RecX [Steroidobacteraceae bacterium]